MVLPPDGGRSSPAAPPSTSQPAAALVSRIGDEATQNTGQVVVDAVVNAATSLSVESAVGLGVIVLVVGVLGIVLLARWLTSRLLFRLLTMIVRQSHDRALARLQRGGSQPPRRRDAKAM